MLIKQKEDERKAIEDANRPEGAQELMSIPLPGQGAAGSSDAEKLGFHKHGIDPSKFGFKDEESMPGKNPEKYGIDPNKLAFMGPPRTKSTKK